MSGGKLQWALVLWVGLLQPAHAAQLTVAVASSVQEPMGELARRFEQASGIQVRPVFGASGRFFAQITQGAPFDLFFSADADYPARLHGQGLGEAPRRYARGRLVLWAPTGSAFEVKTGLGVLREAGIRRVAISNPKLAPYGRAAVEAMRSARVYDALTDRLALGENVAQTFQFVESGGADLALVPLSLAVSPKVQGRGTYWLVPADRHAPLDAEAVLLRASKQRAIAQRFLEYCTGPQAAEVWRRFGLADPR